VLTGTGGGFLFDADLAIGMSGQDVLELQNRLRDEGYFTATPTGYFGPITRSAVMAYQSAMGISATGYVGPLTRAQLNQ
jgi:N-acetylmuramoyl-L-alanine amidase